MSRLKTTPWAWIPTLYIAEGLPYFAVNVMTVMMYNNLGVSKTDMAFYTGWLYLPWVVKPFWSPFVDLFRTKRLWILGMQLLLCISMAAVALMLPTTIFFAATLVAFWIMAFCSATHDIAADGYYMLELNERDQAAYVGVRSTFYRLAMIIGQGGLVILAGNLERATGNVAQAWSLTYAALSLLFLLIFLYHMRFLPSAPSDRPAPDLSAGKIIKGFGETFASFFRKPHIWSALAFMLLYRMPEALCIKLVQPFLVDPVSGGGLGMTTAEVGFANGVVGVAGLLGGGIVGGLLIARGGLRRWIWPMALSLTLPCGVYCLLAHTQPSGLPWISTLIGIEQFGYGFGFTAFMMYLMYFSRGASQTSHYAFCTAFMALGMMVPGMAAGWIHTLLSEVNPLRHLAPAAPGYANFFWLVMACSLFTFLAVALIYPQLQTEPEEGAEAMKRGSGNAK